MAWPATKPTPGEIVLDPFHPINQGLLGWWLMNEGGGTIVHDYSGYGNNGTLNNMEPATDWVISRNEQLLGYALDFDGVDEHIIIDNESVFDFERTDSFSIMASIRADAWASEGIVAKQLGSGGDFQGWSLSIADIFDTPRRDGLTFQLRNTSSNQIVANTLEDLTSTNTEWKRITATYNGNSSGSGVKVYVEGIDASLDVTQDNLSASILTNTPLEINGRGDGDGLFFNGRIDDVRIYKRVLLPNEVLELYENPLAGILRPRRKYFVPAVAGTVVKDVIGGFGIIAFPR